MSLVDAGDEFWMSGQKDGVVLTINSLVLFFNLLEEEGDFSWEVVETCR